MSMLYAERSKKLTFEGEINPQNEKLYKQFYRAKTMQGLSKGTLLNYTSDLNQWFKYMATEQMDLTADEATEDDIEEFIFYCQQEGNNANRIKRRLSSISSFYLFLRKKKIVKDNPVDLIDRPKNVKPVVPQVYLTEEQVHAMKKALKEQGNRQLELYALFSLSTMARVNAVSSVRWSNLDLENKQVIGVVEKGGKENENMYFSEEVKSLILAEKKRREEEGIECDYLFCAKRHGKYDKVSNVTLGLWAKKIGKMIGIEEGLHPHDFRHSGATLLKNMGMELEEVSKLLNHSGTDVTKKFYIKEDNKKLKANREKFNL